MKRAAVISVGTEIMKGKMDDTNSTFITRWLYASGIYTEWRLSVEDDINDIVDAITFAIDADIIILTGGLGPTEDDLTRDALADFLNKELVFNEELWKNDVTRFYRVNKIVPIPESNKRQAMCIEGSIPLHNEVGTAPGLYYKDAGKVFVLLPGPPTENQRMIKNYLANMLKEDGLIDGEIVTDIFRIYNTGESAIADLFAPVKSDCNIGYYFTQEGWIEIHTSYYSKDKSVAEEKVKNTVKDLKELLDKNNFFYTENTDLSKIVLELFKSRGLTLSFAESITGGNLSGDFIKNAGASDVLSGSVVAYSNEIKKNVLGVKAETLEKHGAVSEECVSEMVTGLKKVMGTEVAVSISGIAGPTGDTKEKPLGLVYFGFMTGDEVYCKKEVFFGDRARIIRKCINYVFMELVKHYK